MIEYGERSKAESLFTLFFDNQIKCVQDAFLCENQESFEK